jgi:hypothetical protein
MLPSTTDLLDILSRWTETSSPRIIEYEADASVILMYKIRCDLPKGYSLQIRLRLRADTIEYSYQLFTTRPVLRWDNALHHPSLANFPHHFHDDTDTVHPSDLSSNPLADLSAVLAEIVAYIRQR